MFPIACREESIGGDSYEEKWANAVACELDAIEITGPRPWKQYAEENIETWEKLISKTKLPISAICGSSEGCLLTSDRSERDMALQSIKRLLRLAAQLSAKGVIYNPTVSMVEGWSRSERIPDLSPFETRMDIERRLLVLYLIEIGEFAKDLGVALFLEPVNRFQAYWPNGILDAIAACREADKSSIRILLDVFHMNIEEVDIEAGIMQAKDHIGYVHLSENNRGLPGNGHIDFRGFFRSLLDAGYQGYVSLECNRANIAPGELRDCLRYLRSEFAKAGG